MANVCVESATFFGLKISHVAPRQMLLCPLLTTPPAPSLTTSAHRPSNAEVLALLCPPLWRTAFTVSISITHTGFAGQGLELELGLGSASWSRRRRRRTRKIWQRASVNLHVNENVTPATPASEPLPLPRVRYWEKRGVDLIINI